MGEITNLRDFMANKEAADKQIELDITQAREELNRLIEKFSLDIENYTGDHTLYGEEEEEFALRVDMAVNDLKVNFNMEQLEALKYFYYILKLTGNVDKTNPLLMDIEAFEDIIEPFIVHAYAKSMKDNEQKLSTITDHAAKVVEDLLISDFIYSPYKTKDDTRRFICMSGAY